MKNLFKSLIVFAWIIFASFATVLYAQSRAYIANTGDGTVSVIDTTTRTVIATIPVDQNPSRVAVNEAGTRVYVSNNNTGGTYRLSVIDTATNTVIDTPVVPGDLLASNAAGTKLYLSDGFFGHVYVVDASSYSVESSLPIPSPVLFRGFAVNRQGTFAYETEAVGISGVSVFDLSTNRWLISITTGFGPTELTVSRSGNFLYVINSFESSLSVVNAFTFSAIKKIDLLEHASPAQVVVSPDGLRIYVTTNDGYLWVINAVTNTVITTVPLGSIPAGLTVNPADNSVYVALPAANSVAVVDANTNTVAAMIPVGNNPASYGLFIPQYIPASQQANLAISSSGPARVAIGAKARINFVIENFGPDQAINPNLLIETNAPRYSMFASVSEGWTCMQSDDVENTNFYCSAHTSLAAGRRPIIALTFNAPKSMESEKLVVSSVISSESSDLNAANNTDNYSVKIDTLRRIWPPSSPAKSINRH